MVYRFCICSMCILINLRKANEKHLREMTQSMTELNREREKGETQSNSRGENLSAKRSESPGPCSSNPDSSVKMHSIQALLPQRSTKVERAERGERREKVERAERSKRANKSQQLNGNNSAAANGLNFKFPSLSMTSNSNSNSNSNANSSANFGLSGNLGAAGPGNEFGGNSNGMPSFMNMNFNVPLQLEQYGFGLFGNSAAARNSMFGINSIQNGNSSSPVNNHFGTERSISLFLLLLNFYFTISNRNLVL